MMAQKGTPATDLNRHMVLEYAVPAVKDLIENLSLGMLLILCLVITFAPISAIALKEHFYLLHF